MRCGQQEQQPLIAVYGRAATLASVAGVASAPDKLGTNSRRHVESTLRQFERAVALRHTFPFGRGG
jgi:Flp pilus assembly protein CpaB